MPSPLNRRDFLATSSLLGITAATAATSSASPATATAAQAAAAQAAASSPADATLSFNPNGFFKLVQFNDTQDDHNTDRRTIEFMGKVLDQEKPGFALINGDVIAAGPTTAEQVYQAINNVVMPMESRQIPWAVTFGNHDEDSAEEGNTGVRHAQMVEFVRTFRYNRNAPAASGGYGASNTLLLLRDATSARFALWLLDSGRYRPDAIAGQDADELPAYDYIHPAQIRWYTDRSDELAREAGRTVEGLMFFHIPTYEHRDMWFGGPYNDGLIDHNKAVSTHAIEGEKHEDCYVGAFNSGIYATAQARGDIRGIYCGHDHINTFAGNYFGIELGYAPGTGFAPYGLRDGTWDQNTLRGARVFEFSAADERVYTGNRVVFARDLGIDMNPVKQPVDAPTPFPDYVKLPGINSGTATGPGDPDSGTGTDSGPDSGPSASSTTAGWKDAVSQSREALENLSSLSSR